MYINTNRKMNFSLVTILLSLVLSIATSAHGANSSAAFNKKSLKEAIDAMGAGNAVIDQRIRINAPTLAEIGSMVPIEVESGIPGTETISLLVEKNPFPLASRIRLSNGASSYVRSNLRLAMHSDVHVVVKAGNRYYRNSVPVKVTIGGCGGGGSNYATPTQWEPSQGNNTLVRGTIKDVGTVVRAVIRHPMETGQRKHSKTGKPIPAHYINKVVATHKGKVVYRGEWSASISQNPGFGFRLDNGKPGDKISVSWSDNKGMTGGKTTDIQ
jgi:sulfur-oxidizing protein SoxY